MQEWTDLSKWQVYHYALAGGLVLALIAIVLYFIPSSRLKMPAIVVCSLGFLAAGFGIGVVTLVALGYQRTEPAGSGTGSSSGGGAADAGMAAMKMGMPGRGGRGGGGMGGGRGGMGGMTGGRGGGGRGPTSKTQLVTLVDKLDVLTNKPLAIDMPPEKKAKVAELLRGLDQKTDLTEEEAKAKLDALGEQLKDYKATLEAAGYRWPGDTPPRPPGNAGNPFKEEAGQHLKALQERLTKGK
jgi:hypothetical protein